VTMDIIVRSPPPLTRSMQPLQNIGGENHPEFHFAAIWMAE